MSNTTVAQSQGDSEFFYPLTKKELLKLCPLAPADLKIYLYLKCLDPFGNQILEVDLDEMRQELGIKSMGTIYPALTRLDQAGLINITSRKFHIHVPGSNEISIKKLKNRSIFRSKDQKIDQKIKKLKNSEPEPTQGADSKPSKIIRSNRFKKIERVEDICEADPEYLSFVWDRVNQLPTKPAFPDEVVAKQALKIATKRAYLKHLKNQERVNIPPPPLDPENLRSQRVETLKAWWDKGDWRRVEETLSKFPEWGISYDDIGVNANEPEL